MTKFRNVRVKMRGGKTRIQRAMVLASGKLKFIKNITRSHKSRVSNTPKKTKRSRKTMAKNRSRRRSFFSTGSIFKYLRIAALVAPGLVRYNETKRIDLSITQYAGLDHLGKFQWDMLKRAWLPFVVTTLVTCGIQKLSGIIRRL